MNCPVCNVELRMADRQGIEIDYCPQCRGIWLDRGELDKIIERSMAQTAPRGVADLMRGYREHDDDHYEHEHSGYDGENYKKRKRKGFLGDLLDF